MPSYPKMLELQTIDEVSGDSSPIARIIGMTAPDGIRTPFTTGR